MAEKPTPKPVGDPSGNPYYESTGVSVCGQWHYDKRLRQWVAVKKPQPSPKAEEAADARKTLTPTAVNAAVTECCEPRPTIPFSNPLDVSPGGYWTCHMAGWQPTYDFLTDWRAAGLLWEAMNSEPGRKSKCLYNALAARQSQVRIDPLDMLSVVSELLSPKIIALAFLEYRTGERVEIGEEG